MVTVAIFRATNSSRQMALAHQHRGGQLAEHGHWVRQTDRWQCLVQAVLVPTR